MLFEPEGERKLRTPIPLNTGLLLDVKLFTILLAFIVLAYRDRLGFDHQLETSQKKKGGVIQGSQELVFYYHSEHNRLSRNID